MTSPVPKPPVYSAAPDPIAISDPVDRIQPRPAPPTSMPSGGETTLPFPVDMLPPTDPVHGNPMGPPMMQNPIARGPMQPPMMSLGEGGPAPAEMPGTDRMQPAQAPNRMALARLLMQGRMRGRGQRY